MLKATTDNAEVAPDGERSARPLDGNGGDLLDEGGDVAGHGDQACRPEASAHIAGQLFVPSPLERGLDCKRLHGLNLADGFDETHLTLRAESDLFAQPRPNIGRETFDRKA